MKEISIMITFITSKTEQLHPIKLELRFCTCSNPACSMSEILDGEDLFRRWTIPQKQFIIIINSSSAKVFRSSRLEVSFKIVALVQNCYFMKKWLHHGCFLGKLPIVFRTVRNRCLKFAPMKFNFLGTIFFIHFNKRKEVYSSFNLSKYFKWK